jgi:hypothetical protein
MKIFFSRAKNKRGSLEISINAIVILVMAMVVLGLGLGFIRGLFTKGSDNLGIVLDNAALDNPASADKPITIDQTIKIRAGGSGNIRIGYYNTNQFPVTAKPVPTVTENTYVLTCKTAKGDNTPVRISSLSATVAPGKDVGFKAIVALEPTGGVAAVSGDTIICPLNMALTAASGSTPTPRSAQFFIEVN